MNVLPYFRVDLKRYYVRFISQSEQRDCVRIQGGSKIFTIVRAHHTLRAAPNSPAVLGSYSRVITRLSLLIVRPPLSTVYTKPKPFTAKCRTSNLEDKGVGNVVICRFQLLSVKIRSMKSRQTPFKPCPRKTNTGKTMERERLIL